MLWWHNPRHYLAHCPIIEVHFFLSMAGCIRGMLRKNLQINLIRLLIVRKTL